MKIKKGDNVEIIAGKDRGKRGKVIQVIPSEDRVIVEGLNMMKRHLKSRKEGESGQRIERPAPVHVSNVMAVCQETGKPTRIGYKIEGGEKVRISKKSGKVL